MLKMTRGRRGPLRQTIFVCSIQSCRFIVGVLTLSLLLASQVAAENWPRFRGPTGQGISSEHNLPVRWSATDNIAWKSEIPGEGWSSPIVWEDHVFLTSATDDGKSCRVISLDRRTGEILWNVEVATQVPGRKRTKNSYASPTPVTDGEHVFVVFASGVIVALDYAGNIAWKNDEVRFFSVHGLGASPILVRDHLIMPYDGSSDGVDNQIGFKIPWGGAFVLSVDKRTGTVNWRGRRGLSRLGHVTPVVLSLGGQDQIITCAGDAVQAFDPANGVRLWSVYSKGEGVTPSPVIGERLIFTASGFEEPTIRAIRWGGKDDVTRTHIAWEQKKGVPTQPSLLYVRPHLYAISDQGIATCYQEATGDVVWRERIGSAHCASPIYADGRIYFLSEEGEATVIEAGGTFQVVARNTIPERSLSSYAVSQRNIFIRTDKHLYCVGRSDKVIKKE